MRKLAVLFVLGALMFVGPSALANAPHTPPCVENPNSPKCSSGSTITPPPSLAYTGPAVSTVILAALGFGLMLAGGALFRYGTLRRRRH